MTGMYDYRGQFYTLTQGFGPKARCEAACNGCQRKFELPLPPGDLPASRHDRHYARELNRAAGRHRCRRRRRPDGSSPTS